jgi:hypothetical protein
MVTSVKPPRIIPCRDLKLTMNDWQGQQLNIIEKSVNNVAPHPFYTITTLP